MALDLPQFTTNSIIGGAVQDDFLLPAVLCCCYCSFVIVLTLEIFPTYRHPLKNKLLLLLCQLIRYTFSVTGYQPNRDETKPSTNTHEIQTEGLTTKIPAKADSTNNENNRNIYLK